MPAVGGAGDERLLAQAQEIVGSHQTQHALGVDDEAEVLQPLRDAPIALVAPFERQLLDLIAQVRVLAQRGLGLEPSVVAGARQVGDPGEMGDFGLGLDFALRSLARHLSDESEEMVAALLRRFASHDRKASRKKSSATCWRPITRSRSAMRALALARSSGGRASGGPTAAAVGPPDARPPDFGPRFRFSPAAPKAA